jgi:hypothetical protein
LGVRPEGALRAWRRGATGALRAGPPVLSRVGAKIGDLMSERESASKAAEMAARQVEQIVEAAQLAAEQIKVKAEQDAVERRNAVEAELAKQREAVEAEIAKLRGDATAEAEKEKAEATEEAGRVREEAALAAAALTEQARTEATERVTAAETAADEALADARAISSGLRRLGQSLEVYAENILRDVQAGHRRLRGDLRVAGGGPPATPGERARRAASAETGGSFGDTEPEATGKRGAGAARGGRRSPFEEIDVPEWVGRDEEGSRG